MIMSEEKKTELPSADVKVEAAADEAAPAKEEESTATFASEVKLEVVDVKLGEEEENVMFTKRAKLFAYDESLLDKGTGNKSWLERGVGDIRILRHREFGRLRLLMRQEKTMKLIANQLVDPQVVMEPNVGNDRLWCWSARDFADGELVNTGFIVRFKDSNDAVEFKEAFEKAQKEMQQLQEEVDSSGVDEAKAAIEAPHAM